MLNANYVVLYYGVFKLNQSILAETVCEKKTAGCNACCYLNKKIEQESDESKASAELIKIKQKLSEFTVKYFSLPQNAEYSSRFISNNNIILSEGYYSLPGKPPQTA
jgi:hypothetical protein